MSFIKKDITHQDGSVFQLIYSVGPFEVDGIIYNPYTILRTNNPMISIKEQDEPSYGIFLSEGDYLLEELETNPS